MTDDIYKENQPLKFEENKENREIKEKDNKNSDNISINKEQNIIRNSSFDLLRIILMILIILSNILKYTKSLRKLSNQNFLQILNQNYIFLRIISNYEKFGEILLMMISGYFSVKKLNFHYTKLILIALEIYIYHFLFLYISIKFKDKYKKIYIFNQRKGSYYFALTTFLGNKFIQHYVLLLFFMSYINSGLLSLSYEQYKNLVILIIIFNCIIRSLYNIYEIQSFIFTPNEIINLLLPYIIGGYLRIFDIQYKILLFLKISAIPVLILTIIYEFIFDYLAINYKNYIYIQWQNELSLSTNSIFLFLSSIGIICLCKDIKIYSKIINIISDSIIGIYLIHANKNIAPLVYNTWYQINDYNQKYFLIKYISKAFIIFFICLIIDIIRRYTIGLFIEFILNSINKKLNKNKSNNEEEDIISLYNI